MVRVEISLKIPVWVYNKLYRISDTHLTTVNNLVRTLLERRNWNEDLYKFKLINFRVAVNPVTYLNIKRVSKITDTYMAEIVRQVIYEYLMR